MFSDIFSLPSLRQIEHDAEQNDIPLMQQAARTTYDWIIKKFPKPIRILIASGQGNNGGDALYCGLLLNQQGYQVTIWQPENPKSPATIAVLAECVHAQLPIIEGNLLPPELKPDLIIDGFFGVGLNRNLSIDWQNRISQLNAMGKPILALDTPSGLDAYRGTLYGTTIHATDTLTFICAKPGLHTHNGIDYSGYVYTMPLDIPPELLPAPKGTIAPIEALHLHRPADSHKGLFGTVGVIGGAEGMLGAALLSGRAALNFGAGKVYVGTLAPYSVDPNTPELMFADATKVLTQSISVLAIGPGLSCSTEAKNCLEKALKLLLPMVIDADALNLLAQNPSLETPLKQSTREKILTPHPAEAARLLKTSTSLIQANRVKAAQQIAEKYNAVTILKGAGSIIARADGYYRVNRSGSPALSSAGQGDVLTGMCAAFLAQGLDAFCAASLATYVHGLAGQHYAEAEGQIGLSASATIPLAKKILNTLIRQQNKGL